MKKIFFTTLILIALVTLSGIEVGGHITQDTVWGPENNPYLVSTALYVDSGVTLTLLPGTQMQFVSAFIRNEDGFKWNGRFEPRAKVIIVHGTLFAVGTADNPIIFDRERPDNDYKWGGIYIGPEAPKSTFKYCEIKNTYKSLYAPEHVFNSALYFANGVIDISNCKFKNNLSCIYSGALREDIVIHKCSFISVNDSYPHPYLASSFGFHANSLPEPGTNRFTVTIANCIFTGNIGISRQGRNVDLYFLYNMADNNAGRDEPAPVLRTDYGSYNSYGNVLIGGKGGWGCWSATETDTVFARKNSLIKLENTNPPNTPLAVISNGYGTNYVSDNYLQGYVQIICKMPSVTTSYIYNNVIESYCSITFDCFTNFATSYIYNNVVDSYGGLTFDCRTTTSNQGGQIRIFNNLIKYIGTGLARVLTNWYCAPYIYNNTILGYARIETSYNDYSNVYANNIIDAESLYGETAHAGDPVFYHNCFTLPINSDSPVYIVGNFVADPVFADTLHADYTLADGSPCIDAGILRPDLPDFDLRYHRRISSATEGGPRAVDIGAYEYNSIYIGGITGFIYDSQSGLAVDCAKVEILDKLPEYSNDRGRYYCPTGAGIYTLKVSRWDYQDLIIPGVQVILGENTTLNIPLVNVHDSDIADEVPAPEATNFGLCNYPNPFNPRTMISFIAPQSGEARLSIFNVKGQKIKTLYQGSIAQGYHQLAWDAQDEKGSAIASGIYFAIIEINGKSQVHKMMLIK